MAGTINFSDGQLLDSLRASFSDIAALGNIPDRVHNYLGRGEVDPASVTSDPIALEKSMWRFLKSRGARMTDDAVFNNGGYDELLFSAYDNAIRSQSGGDDPLDAARSGDFSGAMRGWDFRVDDFESVEAQGILAESIRAAGAIDYVFEFGDRMRIFDLADQLVLGWAAGNIDIAEGTAAGKLYRYWKLVDDRSSPDERAGLYRRVLGKGNAHPVGKAIINETFPALWDNLMNEIADYIQKAEQLDINRFEGSPISNRPLYQAMREIQYNCTEFCTGMAFMQVREIYAQLQQAFDILKDPDVIASFGGVRRRNMWTVISELSKEAFGTAPPVAPIVRLAVDGNRIFQLIADFDEGTFSPIDLSNLVEAGESYIINRAVAGDTPTLADSEQEPAEDEWEDDFEDF